MGKFNINPQDIGLYHKDIGFPKNMQPFKPVYYLIYQPHAEEQALEDRYQHNINLPPVLFTKDAELVEVQIHKPTGVIIKALFRQPYDSSHDICIVFQPYDNIVRTVWLNKKEDKHFTLDKSKYQNVTQSIEINWYKIATSSI